MTNRVRQICDFNIHMNEFDSRVSEFDRQFIEAAIATNMAEIQALEFALPRVQNEEWRGLIQMMIAQHTPDLDMALWLAEWLDIDTTPELTNVRVYPETPEFDLGIHRVDLMATFLNPLMAGGGAIPIEMPTAIPTIDLGTPTAVPTLEATSTSTTVPTVDPTTKYDKCHPNI